MNTNLLSTCFVLLPLVGMADGVGATVFVLDGPDVKYMREGLIRIGCAFEPLATLDAGVPETCRVLVISGKKSPVNSTAATTVRTFVEDGGAVLAVGGGAAAMIRHELFDATGYYPSGTTIHMTTFCGYHRLTFGYPGADPEDGWKRGIPMLLRATEGPLLELGEKPISILGCDSSGRYSAAAFQRVGHGMMLLIGPDPQGGNVYYTLDKPKLESGEKLKTDLLLASAIAFLVDPCGNQVPNAGFEQNTDLPPDQSNWRVRLKGNATSEWRTEGAPEGKVYFHLSCPDADSRGSIQPDQPIVVERGTTYDFSCRYLSSNVDWEVQFVPLAGKPRALKAGKTISVPVPTAGDWQRCQTTLDVPEDVAYVRVILTMYGPGELHLDDVRLAPQSTR